MSLDTVHDICQNKLTQTCMFEAYINKVDILRNKYLNHVMDTSEIKVNILIPTLQRQDFVFRSRDLMQIFFIYNTQEIGKPIF